MEKRAEIETFGYLVPKAKYEDMLLDNGLEPCVSFVKNSKHYFPYDGDTIRILIVSYHTAEIVE